eukprot:758739-Hanusia_phi.AAC.1
MDSGDAISLTSVLITPNDCPLGSPLNIEMGFRANREIKGASWDLKVAVEINSNKMYGLDLLLAVHGGYGLEEETYRSSAQLLTCDQRAKLLSGVLQHSNLSLNVVLTGRDRLQNDDFIPGDRHQCLQGWNIFFVSMMTSSFSQPHHLANAGLVVVTMLEEGKETVTINLVAQLPDRLLAAAISLESLDLSKHLVKQKQTDPCEECHSSNVELYIADTKEYMQLFRFMTFSREPHLSNSSRPFDLPHLPPTLFTSRARIAQAPKTFGGADVLRAF